MSHLKKKTRRKQKNKSRKHHVHLAVARERKRINDERKAKILELKRLKYVQESRE